MTASADPNNAAHGVRHRRIKRTAVSGFAAKAAMFLPTLGIAKIVVPILGPERYGVLMTVLSLLAFLGIADLGVGSSLVTSISRALGSAEYARLRRLQANGFVVVGVAACALCALALILFISDAGSWVFATSSAALRGEATAGFAVFVLLFAVSLPLNLVAKIQLGLQRGEIANLWQIVAALINFGAGVLAARRAPSVPWIIAGLMSGTLLCGIANTVVHYWRTPLTRPSWHDISRAELRGLMADSFLYLALQVLFVIAYAVDTLIVARALGAAQVSAYALAERSFSIVAVAVSVITAPLWAAYGEAMGAKDWRWVRRMLWMSTARIGLAASLLSVTIVVLLQPLITLLSTGRLAVPRSLAIAMGGWRVIEAIGSCLSVYMFANQSIKFVLAVGGLTAIVSLICKLLILPHSGLFAVPATMSVCYVLLCMLPTLYYVTRERAPSSRTSAASAVD